MIALVFAATVLTIAVLLQLMSQVRHRPPVHGRIRGGYEVLWRVGQLLLLVVTGLAGLALAERVMLDPAEAYAGGERWLIVAQALAILTQLVILWLTRRWPQASAALLAIYAIGLPLAVWEALQSSSPAVGRSPSEDLMLAVSFASLTLPLLIVALLLLLASNGVVMAEPAGRATEAPTATGPAGVPLDAAPPGDAGPSDSAKLEDARMRTIVNLHTLVTVLAILGALGQLAVTVRGRGLIDQGAAGQPPDLLALLLPLGLSLLLGAVAILNWWRPRLCGLAMGGSALLVLALTVAGSLLPTSDSLPTGWPQVVLMTAVFYVVPAGVMAGLLLTLSRTRQNGRKPTALGPSLPQHPAGSAPAR